MKATQTVEIRDPVYEETYTAHIQKNGAAWIGWIPEVPKVKCEENTREELLKTLAKELHETLEADWEAWDKQLEEDVKAGRLDHLSEKALKNFREGRYYEIEKLQELLKE
ncbi:MAG: hypothetical protein OXL96_26935 [Candidatus Poribacteria bacterium]|nr:hypothetical protein [Candidatus Poribacteria bacterium]